MGFQYSNCRFLDYVLRGEGDGQEAFYAVNVTAGADSILERVEEAVDHGPTWSWSWSMS
jgi:hypothetical protein